ncbi:MAG: DUF6249 domain-containing protein [Bacteroidota bacterium]|nr:DUF6249 domain-containing protein [Bacteroidota bacterium]
MDLTAVLIVLIIFGFIFGIVYLGVRKKERQMLLERGADASIFISKKQASNTLRFGLLFIGVAIGVFLGNILSEIPSMNMNDEAAFFSMIFLFGGIALVVSYFMEKKENEKLEKMNREKEM